MAEVIELPNGLLFQIYTNRRLADDALEVSAQLVRMPDDGGLVPDVVVRTWTEPVSAHDIAEGVDKDVVVKEAIERVKVMAAKDLRALSTAIDGMPIVRYIDVRNDAAYSVNRAASPDNPPIADGLEVLKVLVELEHEPLVQRIVFSRLVEAMGGMISHGVNAYGFAGKEIDPVSAGWRAQGAEPRRCGVESCPRPARYQCNSADVVTCEVHKSSCCELIPEAE